MPSQQEQGSSTSSMLVAIISTFIKCKMRPRERAGLVLIVLQDPHERHNEPFPLLLAAAIRHCSQLWEEIPLSTSCPFFLRLECTKYCTPYLPAREAQSGVKQLIHYLSVRL